MSAQKLKLNTNTAFEFTVKLFAGTESGKFGNDEKFVLTDLNWQDYFFYLKEGHPISPTLKANIGRKLIIGKGDSAFYTKDISGNPIGNAPKTPNLSNVIATPNAKPSINDVRTPFDGIGVNDAVRVANAPQTTERTQTTGYAKGSYNDGLFGSNKEFAIIVQSVLHTECFQSQFEKLLKDNDNDERIVFRRCIDISENLISEVNDYLKKKEEAKDSTNEI